MADASDEPIGPLVEPGLPPAPRPPPAVPGSGYQVLFVRRKPRMFGATYGPIRHDPGTVTLRRDYLELAGSGVQHEGWRAIRIIVPCVLFLGGPIGALIAYFWIEYVLARPTHVVIPLMQIRRVVLDPLRGTVMVGAVPRPGGPIRWHSFATARVWAIFDGLEPLLAPGTCGLLTRVDRALKRGDLAAFLAMCALTPVVGVPFALVGFGAGLSAAMMGERRYGLTAAAGCLLIVAAQGLLVLWYLAL